MERCHLGLTEGLLETMYNIDFFYNIFLTLPLSTMVYQLNYNFNIHIHN